MPDGANECIVEIPVYFFDIGVELEDGSKEGVKLLLVQTVVEFIMGEDVLNEGGEDFPNLFVADRTLLETDAVHKVDDVYNCVMMVGQSVGVGQQTEQQFQDLRAALDDVVNEVRVFPAEASDQFDSLEVEPINSANSMGFGLDSNMLLQCAQNARLSHQPSNRCHVPALMRRQRFAIHQLV